MHDDFKEGLFKKMRRIKPVTGHAFDWSGAKLL